MSNKKTFFYVKIIISLALMMWVFTHVSLEEWAKHISHVPIYLLCMMVGMILLQVVGQGIRWSLILQAFGCYVDAKKTSSINMLSLLCNQTLPSTIGGDIVRMSQIRKEVPNGTVTVQSVVMDRFLGFMALILILGASLPFWWSHLGGQLPVYGLMIMFAAGVILSSMLLCIPAIMARYRNLMKNNWLLSWGVAMRELLSKPLMFFVMMLLSVCLQLINVWVIYMLFGVVQASVGFVDCLLVIPAVTLLSMVPISVGGWGVRESFMMTGFALLGINATSAVSVSLIFGVVLALAGLAGGIIWFIARRRLRRFSGTQ